MVGSLSQMIKMNNYFWRNQLKKGFELALKNEEMENENMENKNKMEVMSNEIMEINNIIALAKADDDIKQVFLSEIVREKLKQREDKEINVRAL